MYEQFVKSATRSSSKLTAFRTQIHDDNYDFTKKHKRSTVVLSIFWLDSFLFSSPTIFLFVCLGARSSGVLVVAQHRAAWAGVNVLEDATDPLSGLLQGVLVLVANISGAPAVDLGDGVVEIGGILDMPAHVGANHVGQGLALEVGGEEGQLHQWLVLRHVLLVTNKVLPDEGDIPLVAEVLVDGPEHGHGDGLLGAHDGLVALQPGGELLQGDGGGHFVVQGHVLVQGGVNPIIFWKNSSLLNSDEERG